MASVLGEPAATGRAITFGQRMQSRRVLSLVDDSPAMQELKWLERLAKETDGR